MNSTDIDLLQRDEKKHIYDVIFEVALGFMATTFLWAIICIPIWENYKGNWVNYYSVIANMVFFILMIIYFIYLSHWVHIRVPLYIILSIISVLYYLNNVHRFFPIVDFIKAFIIYSSLSKHESILYLYNSIENLVGNSFYEALLTWIIIDVPIQLWENEQDKKWEASVKYVYHSILNQILIFHLANADNKQVAVINTKLNNVSVDDYHSEIPFQTIIHQRLDDRQRDHNLTFYFQNMIAAMSPEVGDRAVGDLIPLYITNKSNTKINTSKPKCPIHYERIEAFCKKKIKCYSRKIWRVNYLWLHLKITDKKNTVFTSLLQKQKQYKALLSLLKQIHLNPNNLNKRGYLKRLYSLEAIFERSTIINGNF